MKSPSIPTTRRSAPNSEAVRATCDQGRKCSRALALSVLGLGVYSLGVQGLGSEPSM